jgi:hypothetical protein
MYLENRKSFQLIFGLLAFALATVVGFSLFPLLPPNSLLAPLALLLLYLGAITGFDHLFTPLLPPALAKLFRALDAGAS